MAVELIMRQEEELPAEEQAAPSPAPEIVDEDELAPLEGVNIDGDVFDRGCLVQLNISVWTARAWLPPSCVNGADPHYVKAHKFLVDKDRLRPIEQIRNEVRGWLYGKTLPFPINGVLFIPKDMIPETERKLQQCRAAFDAEVDKFVQEYNELIDVAKEKLGSLFNANNYPTDVRRKFGFGWRFFVMSSPGSTEILSPELYEREAAKFTETIREFREDAVRALRNSFGEMVEKIVDKLGDNKRFKDSTITNFLEFLADFEKLNISDDEALAALVEQSRQIMTTGSAPLDPQDLRDDHDLRATVASGLAQIQVAVLDGLVDRPRRRIQI